MARIGLSRSGGGIGAAGFSASGIRPLSVPIHNPRSAASKQLILFGSFLIAGQNLALADVEEPSIPRAQPYFTVCGLRD